MQTPLEKDPHLVMRLESPGNIGFGADGRPLPMVLREQRVWGTKEKRFERVLPRLSVAQLAGWLQDAHVVDGIVKGLKDRDWPDDPWQALHRLALQVCRGCMAR